MAFLPDHAYGQELLRPWKVATFALGMAVMLYPAFAMQIPDWDIGVTLLMGSLTYLTAPWSFSRVMYGLRYRPKGWLLHVLAGLAMGGMVSDTVYVIYHTALSNIMFREFNFLISYPLYFIAGAFWFYRGSLLDFLTNLQAVLHPADNS